MPITQLDRQQVREIQERAISALQREFEADGLDVRCEGGTFAPGYLKSKITFSVRSTSGQPITPESHAFDLACRQFGLQPEDKNKFFVSGGTKFQIVGISPRSWKRPIIALNTRDGKRYKFSQINRSNLMPA